MAFWGRVIYGGNTFSMVWSFPVSNRFLKSRLAFLLKLGAYSRMRRLLDNGDPSLENLRQALPFKILDRIVATDRISNLDGLRSMTGFLPANQPLLMTSILADLKTTSDRVLRGLFEDTTLHPLTRFEAAGWANFIRHRRALPLNRNAPQTPKRIVQFWDQKAPPGEIQSATQKWAALSGHSHQLFDEATAYDFIRDIYGLTAAAQFASLWHPALKSDLFRLYYLFEYGGIYADADALPKNRSASLTQLAPDHVVLSSMTALPNCATINGLIATPPKTPFIGGYLAQVLKNIADQSHRKIFWLSGPGALTLYLYHHPETARVLLLPQWITNKNYFSQFDAPYKHTEKNWRVFEHNQTLSDEDVLRTLLPE